VDVFRQLKSFYWPHRKLLFLSIAALVCVTALGLVQPYLLRVLIDDVIMAEQFDLVPAVALSVVGVVIVKASMQFLHGFTGGRLGNRVAYNLRNALYKKLQYLSFQYYDTAKTGDLMSRLTGDRLGRSVGAAGCQRDYNALGHRLLQRLLGCRGDLFVIIN